MTPADRHYFSLHELLIMAALAALGGVSGSAVSLVGRALFAAIGLPGGLQFLAGLHVLWLVLAIGLIRKPGAATATALLKGSVELLTGNPHGLLVLALSGLAGVTVDVVWLLAAGRNRPWTYVLAGGFAAASNLIIFKLIVALPDHRGVTIGLIALTGVAFVSGAVLAGALGWALLEALRRSGVAGRQSTSAQLPAGRRGWVSVGVLGLVVMLCGIVAYLAGVKSSPRATAGQSGPASAPGRTIPPR